MFILTIIIITQFEIPKGWSKYHNSELDEIPTCNSYAALGMIEELREMASLDSRLLHFQDDNGWGPVSVLSRNGFIES
jgi:hypothetical protein